MEHLKDYFYGFISGCLMAVLVFYSIPSEAADGMMIVNIVNCESSGRHDAVGDDGISYGIAQFRKETFYEFAKQSRIKGLRYRNPAHQLILLNWALDNGYGYRWTCYRKLYPTEK